MLQHAVNAAGRLMQPEWDPLLEVYSTNGEIISGCS